MHLNFKVIFAFQIQCGNWKCFITSFPTQYFPDVCFRMDSRAARINHINKNGADYSKKVTWNCFNSKESLS